MLLGIFVGGASRRMGGHPKGLLEDASGEPLVVRLARVGRDVGLEPVLVGAAEAYAGLVPELPRLADAPAGIGPLGGLAALLEAAQGARAIAVACDMPRVSKALLARLSGHAPAAVVAPRSEIGSWEPLCAAYDSAHVLPALRKAVAEGVRSFQLLLARVDVAELALSAAERAELVDWDAPSDIVR